MAHQFSATACMATEKFSNHDEDPDC